jgi:hypothetical protein
MIMKRKVVLVSPYVFDRIRTATGNAGAQGFVHIETPSGAEVIQLEGMSNDQILCCTVDREINFHNDYYLNLYEIL